MAFAKRVSSKLGSTTYEVMISDLTAEMIAHFKARVAREEASPSKTKYTWFLEDRIRYSTTFNFCEIVELSKGKNKKGEDVIIFDDRPTLVEQITYRTAMNNTAGSLPSTPSAPAVSPSNVDRMPEFDSE